MNNINKEEREHLMHFTDKRTRSRNRGSSVSERQESRREEGTCNSNDDQDHFERDEDNLSRRTGIRLSFFTRHLQDFMRHVYLFCPLSLWVFGSRRNVASGRLINSRRVEIQRHHHLHKQTLEE